MHERKLCENRRICGRGGGGGHGAPIHFTGGPGIYQYHNENIPMIEIKCYLYPNPSFRQHQSKID